MVFGLGNPWSGQATMRHNAGAAFVTRLAAEAGVVLQDAGDHACGRGTWNTVKLTLLRSNIDINHSGVVAERMLLPIIRDADAQAWIAHDDVTLPLGVVRLRRGGGAGGHSGVGDVLRALPAERLYRLRLGIGQPSHGSVWDFVVEDFSDDEMVAVEEQLREGIEAFQHALVLGLDRAQALHHRR